MKLEILEAELEREITHIQLDEYEYLACEHPELLKEDDDSWEV